MLKGLIEGFEINIENFERNNLSVDLTVNFICPGSFGMKELDVSECTADNCKKCWEQAIIDFKNNNNLR